MSRRGAIVVAVQTFHTSRGARIGFLLAGILFTANGVLITAILPREPIAWGLLVIGLLPLWIAWAERTPIVELHPDKLIVRTARLRPFAVDRPPIPLTVEHGPMGLGWSVRSQHGELWARVPSGGLFGVMFGSSTQSAVVQIGRIFGPDNERLGHALAEWVARDR